MMTTATIDPVGHLPLVKAIARGFLGRGVDFDDLVGEGCLALVRASRKFDPARGNEFATFATPCIEGAMKTALEDKAHAIRISRITSRGIRRGLGPDSPGLTEYRRSCIRSALAILRASTFGDHSLLDDTLAERIPDHRGQEPHEDGLLLLASRGVSLEVLTEREAAVLRLRYGLDGDGEASHTEAGKALGISQQHVQRIEQTALDRLRRRATRPRVAGQREANPGRGQGRFPVSGSRAGIITQRHGATS